MAKDGAQLSDESSGKNSMEGGEDEKFYDDIEAPKFVDFTVPDHYRPDDRYWFCLRVGCDQKHEEEMDSEAIYKNFVLRVMAARSPNVRLHKALSRNASGKNMKCPLSAPPKSAKSRLPRLAIVSLSQKMGVVDKEKFKLLPKVSSTPKTKGKQVAAKYLTTPRNKKIPSNSNSFRSVRNPKQPAVAVPKNRLVAKALVFHSPKKVISLKSSVELRTPLTKLCQGRKKLEISSQSKRVLGYSSKPSKPLGHDSQKSLPLHSSSRQKLSNKEKSRTNISLYSHSQNAQDTKSLRSGKCKSKSNLSKHCSSKEIVQHDCTRETITKSRNDTEEHVAASKISVHHTSTNSAKEAACPVSEVHSTSTKDSKGKFDSSEKSSQVTIGGSDIPRFQALNEEDDSVEGNALKQTKESSENEENLNDHVTEFDPSKGATRVSQMTDSDDKENAAAFGEISSISHSNIQTGKEILGMKNNDKKVAQAVDKNSKVSATIAVPGVKLMKPKPTNPKPFRLRTGERGILREANLERKNHTIAPRKEAAAITKSHTGEVQGHHGDIQKGSRTTTVKIPKGQLRKKTPTTPKSLRPLTSILASNPCQDSENDSRKKNSPSTRILQPPRMKQMASQITPPAEQHSLTTEFPAEDSKALEFETPSKNGSNAGRTRTPSHSKSLSQGRRAITIPKEPNFHTSHMPKSCVKKVA